MAGFALKLDFDGLGDALRIFQRVRNLGEDVSPLLDIGASILEASVLRRFDEEKGPGGVPWPKSQRALGKAPNYRGQKVEGKTLTDSSDLRDSIRTEVRQYGRSGEIEVGSDGLKNPVKAIANQTGSHRQTVVVRHQRTINSAFGIPLPQPVTFTVRGHGMTTNLPARPFIGFDEDDKRDLSEAWTDYIIGLLNA